MTGRRAALFAMLVYVTLDLSMPMMPGAFVFALEDSVESLQGSRGRSAGEVVRTPALAVDSSTRSLPQFGVGHRLMSPPSIAPPMRRVVNRLPRATLVSPPAPEDLPYPLLPLQ